MSRLPDIPKTISASLDLIAWSEIGNDLLSMPETDDGYKVLVGCTAHNLLLFTDYSHHPHIYNDHLNSTAAGRYQLLFRYWNYYQRTLHLLDFGPASQDKIAVQQLRECSAYRYLVAGNVQTALQRANRIWASLPEGESQKHTMTEALDKYRRLLNS